MTGKKKPRVQYKVYDSYSLSLKERALYLAIIKETIQKNVRCAKLSHRDFGEMTGIKRTTVTKPLDALEKRRLISIDRTEKTHIICIVNLYKEILR